MAIDPVCKMTVDERTAKLKSEYKGKNTISALQGARRHLMKRPRNIWASRTEKAVLFIGRC